MSSNLIKNKDYSYKENSIYWMGFKRSNLINESDLNLIESDQISLGLVKVLLKLNKIDVAGFSLNKLDGLLVNDSSCYDDNDTSKHLNYDNNVNDDDNELIELLIKSNRSFSEDRYINLQSLKILTLLLSNSVNEAYLLEVFKILFSNLLYYKDDIKLLIEYTSFLCQLVLLDKFKQFFFNDEHNGTLNVNDNDNQNIITVLTNLLNNSNNSQLSYNILFIIWSLSFNSNFCQSNQNLIPHLSLISKSTFKENLVRLTLSTFINYFNNSYKSSLKSFLALPLSPILNSLNSRKWSDNELKSDLEFLINKLNSSSLIVSNYDHYKTELSSGLLTWSPVHNDINFWKHQSKNLLLNDYSDLKLLIHLLTSNDDQVLLITLHDLNQFLLHYYNAKTHLNKADHEIKVKIMNFLNHSNSNIRFQSLITTQSLLSQSWKN